MRTRPETDVVEVGWGLLVEVEVEPQPPMTAALSLLGGLYSSTGGEIEEFTEVERSSFLGGVGWDMGIGVGADSLSSEREGCLTTRGFGDSALLSSERSSF